MHFNFRCDKAEGRYHFKCISLPSCPGALAVHDGEGRVDKAVGNLERKRHLIASKL